MKTLLIKLSGGGLGSPEKKYDEETIQGIADRVAELLKKQVRVALVVGGGNLFRGKDLAGALGVKNATADYIGMLATVQNALVLRDFFESIGIPARVSSAIAMPQLCESYIPHKAQRHMDKGRVVIFAAGLGVPFFTTDSCAVQRALEIEAEALVMAKEGIDGVYTADPRTDESAQKISDISASEALEQNLKFADASAMALAKEHGLPIKVVSTGDIGRASEEGVGTTIRPE